MKVGDLVRVQHTGSHLYDGKIAIVTGFHATAGFRDTYVVKIPCIKQEIGLFEEQCIVICEDR